jgi:hypothetical protein
MRKSHNALLIIMIATLICMNTAASSYVANEILTFEFSLTLPDYPSRMAWSPDNRFLAATQFNEGASSADRRGTSAVERPGHHWAASRPDHSLEPKFAIHRPQRPPFLGARFCC